MKSRERILAALNGAEMDRVPITEIGIWPETLRRWQKEGMPKGISPQAYFHLDKIEFFSFDASLMLKERVITQNHDTKVYSDSDGCIYKMFVNRPGASQFIDSLVKSVEDWIGLKGNLKPQMERFEKFGKDIIFGQSILENQRIRYEKCIRNDVFTALVPLEPCWYYLRLLGEEEALTQIALDPKFAGTIIKEYNDFSINMLKTIFAQGYHFDALWVFSDLCYKNGMLFSPKFYREYVMPEQKRLFELAKENQMKVIYHCDGYVGKLLPLLIEAGIDCIQPLEARAGNDVRDYIQQYEDKISFMGNINMDILTTTKEQIIQEITGKVLAAKKSHRYLYHSDHSVPDNISLENYQFALKVANEAAWY
ncbi:MAG: uroporphyrinogen decarboxylase family protein [Candidatus Humimicrobiaceae bacterium]